MVYQHFTLPNAQRIAKISALAKKYHPTDTVVFGHDAEVSHDTATYTKKKAIALVKLMAPKSLFRFKFDLLFDGAGTAYGRIYRNGIAIGTERYTTSGAYVTFTEDINTTNWEIEDTIELWLKVGAPPGSAKAENFRICGTPSEFEIGAV